MSEKSKEELLDSIAIKTGFQNWRHLNQNSCITTFQVKHAMESYATQECASAVKEALEGQWVECSDRLPELIPNKDNSENVLAWSNGVLDVMCLCYISDGDDASVYCWASCNGEINGDGEFDDDYNVTHWMPLPQPPKTESE